MAMVKHTDTRLSLLCWQARPAAASALIIHSTPCSLHHAKYIMMTSSCEEVQSVKSLDLLTTMHSHYNAINWHCL